jgi:hypothetical protein
VGCVSLVTAQREGEEYDVLGGLFGLVRFASDLVLLEAGIALADDSLDLGELARLLLHSHVLRCMCCVELDD